MQYVPIYCLNQYTIVQYTVINIIGFTIESAVCTMCYVNIEKKI